MLDDRYAMNKFLGKITNDFIKIYDKISTASYEIRTRGFENPIFIISKKIIKNLGPVLLKTGEQQNIFNYQVTYLEILKKNNFISEDKLKDFKTNYKNPDEYCCILIIDPEFSGFIYIPYPTEESE